MNEDNPVTAASKWWCGNCKDAVDPNIGYCNSNNWMNYWVNQNFCNN